MAVTTKKKKGKPKKAQVRLTLWDVLLSYPDLHEPKPFKGKIYYKTDVLMESDHSQLGDLRGAIKKVRTDTWGTDKSEWPEEAAKRFIKDGNERQDAEGYKDRLFITPKSTFPIPVVDPKGKSFNPQLVRGGMHANVAIIVTSWSNDGEEGLSIYLEGIQIDTSQKSENFGGGRSVQDMFGKGEEGEEEESTEEEDDQPRGKKKKRPADDEEEEESSEESEEESSEDDEPPAKKKKKASKNFDEDDE